MSNFKELYNKEIIKTLMDEYHYTTVMQVPRIEKIVINRQNISTNIETVGTDIAQKYSSQNLRVALYGMSNRVLDILRGFSSNENMNVTAYIAECSQKNKDLNYSDDYKYFEAIKQKGINNVRFFQIPDIMLYDLIADKQIDMILFGIHAVFVDKDKRPQIIRNINGIGLFTRLALENEIQVLMVGEKEKIRPANEMTKFSVEETKEPIYKSFISSGMNILRNVRRNEEIKYDPRITIITEDGEYKI